MVGNNREEDDEEDICIFSLFQFIVRIILSILNWMKASPMKTRGKIKSWPEICAAVGMNEMDEQEFLEEYGFYITDRTLTYKYRTSVFVEEIVIER